ncbi:hypothetical protein GGR09_000523 [Bartonella heixiaziensis]
MFGSFNTFGHVATSNSFCGSHNSRPFYGNSTPTYGNAYNVNDFTSHMNAQGF